MATKLNDEAIDNALQHHTLWDMIKDEVFQYNTCPDDDPGHKELLAAKAGYLLQLAWIRQQQRRKIDVID